MAVAKTNGLNGHTNGHANGTTKSPKTNGRAAGPITKRSPRALAGPGIFARLFSITARLFTWYSIITVLFRCPSTLEACNESTPQICGPYFQAKNAVSPHLSPYYNTYAAPYVDLAKPYYEVVDRTVIAPGRNYAVKYAGPRVTQAQAYGKAQWEKSVQPQIVKYQGLAKGHYDQTLAPHVNTASKALAPYYSIAKTNALQTYHEVVSPAYVAVAPYAIQGYNTAHNFAITTALPSGLWAWHKTNKFLDTTVWPHVHDIYAAKVEPQLNRIGERLGRYSDKKARPSAVTEDTVVSSIASSFAKPSASVSSAASVASESVASIASKIVSEVTSLTATEKPMETVAAAARAVEDAVVPEQNEDARDSAARIVQDDLDMWEGKFTKVAEEGASEIEDRIEQVAARMIEQDLNPVGRQTTVKLYNTILQEMSRLHAGIRKSLEANVGNMDKLDEDVLGLLRQTGLPIKNAAQEVRQWRQNFDQELEAQVTLVVQEHFAILEETRDLAISKIGMKWAWMDGVTYKDWQKYHELKDKFRDWINDLKRLIVEHPALLEAQQQAAVIDEEAMAIAEHAVKDLMKLKDIARYKAIAGDFSDNFLEEEMELAALRAEKKRATEAREAARAETARAEAARAADAAKEAAAHGTESVASVAAAATEALKDTIVNAGSDARKSSGYVAEDVTDTETSAVPPLDSLTEEPTESATDLAPDATNEAEPYETLAGEELALEDGPEQVVEEIVEESEQPLPPPATTPEVKSAWLGAAAQAVPSRQPIIDEEYFESAQSAASVIQSDVPASITSAAQAAYTAAIAQAANQYSKALSIVSVQISGEPKPLQEQMYSSVSDAYFAALATANAGLNSALTAASEGVYGTPTSRWMPAMPTVPSVDWERVQSIAQQNLDDSLGWANKQYEAAKVAAAEQVEAAKVAVGAAEPSPSTYLEAAQKRAQKIQEQAQHNYYAGMGVAYARYSEFLAAASTAVSSLTATPTPTNIQGSASSVASVASASAASAASVATGSAASVASIASASAASAASVASGAAISVASDASQLASDAAETVAETWDSLVSAVSSQVYGAPVPTPWYENVYATAGDYAAAAGAYAAAATDAAGQQYSQAAEFVGDYASSAGDYAASATNAAGEQLSQVTNVVNDYAVSASSAADVQYSAVSSLVSELIIGKEPTFTESVYSRLAGAYDFGLATAASIASVASETIMSAASEVTESASSVISVVEETVASATEKVKETIESVRDEL